MVSGVYTVSEISAYIKSLFTRDYVLTHITISGEVSNCKYTSSGHIYFTLKDSGAQLACIMFAKDRDGLSFKITDGQQIEAMGQVAVYEKTGRYQLYVRKCTLSGAGKLYEEYLRLKDEMEEMGMFDSMYKKPIPRYCLKIGVVTALTGAAIQDIINVSTRRNPYVKLVLYPSKVQGEGAAESISKGIKTLDSMDLDVIIVGRGGGSIEDLWAFNEPLTANAIFDARTPIISAVGHETDFTIADFVADLRAPTPSAAAEMANFIYADFMQEQDAMLQRMQSVILQKSALTRAQLGGLADRLRLLAPQYALVSKKEYAARALSDMKRILLHKLDEISDHTLGDKNRIDKIMHDRLKNTLHRLQISVTALHAASPLNKMSGGYGYLLDAEGSSVHSVMDVDKGDSLRVFLKDGRLDTIVTERQILDHE